MKYKAYGTNYYTSVIYLLLKRLTKPALTSCGYAAKKQTHPILIFINQPTNLNPNTTDVKTLKFIF